MVLKEKKMILDTKNRRLNGDIKLSPEEYRFLAALLSNNIINQDFLYAVNHYFH